MKIFNSIKNFLDKCYPVFVKINTFKIVSLSYLVACLTDLIFTLLIVDGISYFEVNPIYASLINNGHIFIFTISYIGVSVLCYIFYFIFYVIFEKTFLKYFVNYFMFCLATVIFFTGIHNIILPFI